MVVMVVETAQIKPFQPLPQATIAPRWWFDGGFDPSDGGLLQSECYNRRLASAQGRKIYNSKQWIDLRKWYRANEPLCRSCLERGEDEAASDLDHIVPLDEGGDPYDKSNLQPLCRQCHREKTAEENRRRRFRQFRPLVDREGKPLGSEGQAAATG